jgi:hypothetical protein
MTVLQEWLTAQDSPEVVVNENFDTLGYAAVYGYNPATSSGLTWGYYGGRWSGFAVAAGTLTLTDSATNYVVVQRSDGAISVSTATTNWNDATNYARVYRIVTSGGNPTNIYGADFDYRAGDGGIFGSSGGGGGGGGADLATANTWTAGQRGAIVTLSDGASITPDMDDGNFFTVTLGGNRTLENPTNLTAGQSGSIFIVQDGAGNRTLAYGSQWDFAGGTAPTLSTAIGAVDRLDYVVRTTGSIHAALSKAYS